MSDDVKRDEKGRFVPGQSGNPGGRPTVSIVDEIKRKLKEVPPNEQEDYARLLADRFITWLWDEACAGRMHGWAFRDLMDRVDGKPKQVIDYHNDREVALLQFLSDTDRSIWDSQNLSYERDKNLGNGKIKI